MKKLYAVTVLVLQSAESAEQARFNVNAAIGEIMPGSDFESISAIQTTDDADYEFAACDAYLN